MIYTRLLSNLHVVVPADGMIQRLGDVQAHPAQNTEYAQARQRLGRYDDRQLRLEMGYDSIDSFRVVAARIDRRSKGILCCNFANVVAPTSHSQWWICVRYWSQSFYLFAHCVASRWRLGLEAQDDTFDGII